jgi:hypothetical protein
VSEDGSVPDENSFAILGDHPSTKFGASKRVFDCGASIRFELAKDQSIVIAGVCNLWVRDGSVSVLGARLRASSIAHRIYVPITHQLPEVTAWSATADLVLQSIRQDELSVADIFPRSTWQVSEDDEMSSRSFSVVCFLHLVRLESKK